MHYVAKLMLVDERQTYLLLHRSDHPSFPYDPDLPGGTIENGENPTSAILREVKEETGIVLDANAIERVYESSVYDSGYTYYLYRATCTKRPDITISWEHSSYEWLSRADFMRKTYNAADNYMRMVYDYLAQQDTGSGR